MSWIWDVVPMLIATFGPVIMFIAAIIWKDYDNKVNSNVLVRPKQINTSLYLAPKIKFRIQ